MRRIPTGGFDFASVRGRWLRYGVCFAGAVVVAGALFVLMKALVRTPRTHVPSRIVSVTLLDRVPSIAAPPARQKRARRPTPVAVPRPAIHSVTPASVTGGMRPFVRSLLSPAVRGRVERTAPSLPRVHKGSSPVIHWRRALGEYLKRHSSRPAPFALRTLPPRKPSIQELPERMRLIGGAEIDRIGTHCYAVPASGYSIDATISRAYAQSMQSLRPLFAHEVPCNPGTRKTPGETFLEELTKCGYGPP